jgi:hypothetical protein
MQIKNEPFCWAPWISLQHGNTMQGTTPCCEWLGKKHSGNLKDYFEGDYLKQIKKAMLDNDMDFLNKTCAECIESEKIGIKTRRLKYFNDPAVENNKTDSIIHLDYRPSNICNLKCSMCNPGASSLIAKEYLEHGSYADDWDDFVKQNHIIPNDYKNINLENLKSIMVIGGEPSIQKDVFDFLDHCCELGINKTCHLQFTTNATNCNNAWISRIKKWPSISVEISLDGIGKTFEYIRTNANWSSIEKNCLWYENNIEDVTYHVTALMYNVPNVEDWIEWFLDKKDVAIYPVSGVSHLSLDGLQPDIKKEKIKYLKQFDRSFVKNLIEMILQSNYKKEVTEKLVIETQRQQAIRKGDIYKVNPIYKQVIPGLKNANQ